MNDGAGQFSVSTELFDAVSTQASVAADFDGDGDADLFITQSTTSRVLLNDGLGGFTNIALTDLSTTLREDLEVGDMDNDGDIDVLAIGSNDFEFWENDGTGDFYALHRRERPLGLWPCDRRFGWRRRHAHTAVRERLALSPWKKCESA